MGPRTVLWGSPHLTFATLSKYINSIKESRICKSKEADFQHEYQALVPDEIALPDNDDK